ncbi:MAG: hypothetical protein NVS3B21_26060 [Acidimicrobiales bacterium]
MLTEFQQELAAIVRDLAEAGDFALAGGAALALQGVPDRVTNDLDYFATAPPAVDRLLPVLEEALRAAGLAVERRQVAPGFARLEASRGPDVCEIDLGYDFRLRPATMTPLGAVLTAEELAADKTLAVCGRGLARDYVDVYGLMRRFGQENLLEWAAAKDLGFNKVAFADMLGRIDRLPRDDFALDDEALSTMKRELGQWREQLLALERPLPEQDRGHEPPGLSL